MARFKFTALDSKGKEVHGEIEADTQSAAIARIKEKQYFPTKVEEAGAGGGGSAPGRRRRLRRGGCRWSSSFRSSCRGG